MRCTLIMLLLCSLPSMLFAARSERADDRHKQWICKQVCKNVDALLYEDPTGHGKTITCSWNDDYLLIKPNVALNKRRLHIFTFLAFSSAGFLFNSKYLMPSKIYVGYSDQCQVLTSLETARLQHAAKYDGNQGFQNAMRMSAEASEAYCPEK